MAEKTATLSTKFQVLSIAVNQIRPSYYQARKTFDDDTIKSLAESMKQEGLIQPITVIRADERVSERKVGQAAPSTPSVDSSFPQTYELVSGERRLRAAKLLGWEVIDARVIKTISPGESAAKGLIENLQREDLNPIEEAEGFDHLNKLSPDYWDQSQIAKVTGRTQGYISQSISLLKLAPDIQDNIRRLIYSRSLGIEIGRLDNFDHQRKVISSAGKNPTVKSVRNRVDEELGWKSRKEKKKATDPLADFWSKLTEENSSDCSFRVKFDGQAWSFHVSTASAKSKPDDLRDLLAGWFDQMAKRLQK